METADNCRRAAFEAVADVEPPRLHELVETILEEASMVPGVLTVESAATVADATDDGLENILTHAAGVQLIYEGLRLTRTLAHDEPWTTADADGDLEILAADILVARGFYLLARTDAASTAVRTVQSFGHDQTTRQAHCDDPDVTADELEALDANLERDVLELAILTGAAAVEATPSSRLLAAAEDVAADLGSSFPPTTDCLEGLESVSPDHAIDDGSTDRATSATDH